MLRKKYEPGYDTGGLVFESFDRQQRITSVMANCREQKSSYELQHQLQDLESLFVSFNPSYTLRNMALQSYSCQLLERGSSYEAYSLLRDLKLRQRKAAAAAATSDPKKKVSFLGAHSNPSEASVVAQSVPDFSRLLRKENKKPNMMSELTPPAMTSKSLWRGGGVSKSASGGEKRGGVGLNSARKSCVNWTELKGLSVAAASAIDEVASGRSKPVAKKTVVGSRLY